MGDQMRTYEEAKKSIYFGKDRKQKIADLDDDMFNRDLANPSEKRVEVSDVIQIGSKVLIGAGLGLLAGVATIAVSAAAAEVVIAGAVTKVAGVVGGALGLSLGISKIKKKGKKQKLS